MHVGVSICSDYIIWIWGLTAAYPATPKYIYLLKQWLWGYTATEKGNQKYLLKQWLKSYVATEVYCYMALQLHDYREGKPHNGHEAILSHRCKNHIVT